MKKSKLNFVFITVLILLVIVLTGFGWKGWIKNASGTDVKPVSEIKALAGTSEFYFKPADDNRLWHVINKYDCSEVNTRNNYNMSSYTFSADSVCVVNEYVSIPEGMHRGSQFELNISELLLK